MTGVVVDLVLVRGEYRARGVLAAGELEELERAHDAGDLRAETTLELITRGRRGDALTASGPTITCPTSPGACRLCGLREARGENAGELPGPSGEHASCRRSYSLTLGGLR